MTAFKLWVQCVDLTPWFWRILPILWSTLELWPVAFCQTKVSLNKSQILLPVLCPEFSIAQGGNVFSFGMRISGRESALKRNVLNSGVEVILYNVYMGQCFTIWEIHVPHSFFLIFMWLLLVFITPSLGSASLCVTSWAQKGHSLYTGQCVGPGELRPGHELFVCPRTSDCNRDSLGITHSSLGQMLLLITSCQAWFAFSKCTKDMASTLCNSHLCSSFVLTGSFLD